MIRSRRLPALWAAREIIRRPAEALLLVTALLLVVLATATPLLLTQAVTATADGILERSPAVVVRRLNAGGWAPIPVREAVSAALGVPGVIAAHPRIWGTAAGPGGTVTVVGLDRETLGRLPGATPFPPLDAGQCIAGPALADQGPGPWLLRNADRSVSLTPVAALSADTGIVAQDIVLVTPADARRLLAIPPDHASDLALEIFHEQEQEAVLPELAAAFPWPVRMVTRREAETSSAAGWSRPATAWLFLMTPAILAMALIVLATVRERFGRRREIGLLRTVGWTSGDIVRLHLLKGIFIALPAIALGLSGACLLVFCPGVTWPARLFFGWDSSPPALHLNPAGSWLTMVQVAALTLFPYLAALLWPAARGATGDPAEMLRGDG
jgi:hypothetical protein